MNDMAQAVQRLSGYDTVGCFLSVFLSRLYKCVCVVSVTKFMLLFLFICLWLSLHRSHLLPVC